MFHARRHVLRFVAIGLSLVVLVAAAMPPAVVHAQGAQAGARAARPVMHRPTAEPPVLTIDQLQVRASVLTSRRDALASRVLELELARQVAEDGYDLAVLRYSEHIVEIYKQGDSSRMAMLIAARDASDAVIRAEVAAQLAAHDRRVVEEFQQAATGIEQAARRTERMTAKLDRLDAQVGEMLQRIDNIANAAGPVDPKQFSLDSNLIFETSSSSLTGFGGGFGSVGASPLGALVAGGGGEGDGTCSPPSDGQVGTGQVEFGEASWYGPGFNGNATANGETYDQFALTAAHKSLPMDTVVRVTAANGRCVFVRINDRGPFIDGRIIDLSYAAAQRLGIDGTMDVQLEVWQ